MRLKSYVLALALSLPGTMAGADVAQTINDRILPDLAAFRAASETLAETAAQTCAPQQLRPAWNAAFDAWLPVSFLHLGPGEEQGRNLAIAFWPDPKGIGARQQRQLLAARDPAIGDPAAFAEDRSPCAAFSGLSGCFIPPSRWRATIPAR